MAKLDATAASNHKFQINIYRLDIFNNVFEQIIADSKLFGQVLNRIKVEYDEYLFYLLRNQQLIKLNHKNSLKSLGSAREKYSTQSNKIKEANQHINSLEKTLAQQVEQNIQLAKSIEEEVKFYKTNLEREEQQLSESKLNLIQNEKVVVLIY